MANFVISPWFYCKSLKSRFSKSGFEQTPLNFTSDYCIQIQNARLLNTRVFGFISEKRDP